MNRFKLNPPLVLVAILTTALAAETGWMMCERGRATRALGALEAKKEERDRLARMVPSPSEGSEMTAAAAVAEAERRLVDIRKEWEVSEESRSGVNPGGSIDEYFSLSSFSEKSRARMREASIGVAAGERFGFADYASAGPSPDDLPVVRRHREMVQHLVETLVQSRPVEFLGIRRSKAGVRGERAASPPSGDHFTMPEHLSVAQPGMVETEAFRVEFTGHTPALRHFLNNVAGAARPVIVRSLEVEAAHKREGAPRLPESFSSTLAEPEILKFTLIVEVPRVAGDRGGGL